MKIKFKYLGDTSIAKGIGKIVIAYTNSKFGVAFCSPDDKFNKHYGKGLATMRLIESPISYQKYLAPDKDNVTHCIPKSKVGWICLIERTYICPNWLTRLKKDIMLGRY